MIARSWLASAAILLVLTAFGPMAWAQAGKSANRSNTRKTNQTTESDRDDKEKAVSDDQAAEKKPHTELATFGGGCFWCVEAVFERVPGVKDAVSGYAGGNFPKPTYEMVSTGETGHAEVVQLEFDPKIVSYDKLLEVFFTCHDPTTSNSQGPDFGTQYRSIILTHNESQQRAAVKLIDRLNRERVFGAPVVTDVLPLQHFYKAEAYHQDYFRKHPNQPYCQAYIPAKLAKLSHIDFPVAEPATDKDAPAGDREKSTGEASGGSKEKPSAESKPNR